MESSSVLMSSLEDEDNDKYDDDEDNEDDELELLLERIE